MTVVINYTAAGGGGGGGGGGGAAVWGGITGTLSAQTDLQTVLTGKLGAPVSYNAATNTPSIASGVAPTGSTSYVVTNAGITTLGTAIDGITSVRLNDQIQWVASISQWVRYAGPPPAPIAVSAALTLVDAYDDVSLVCSSTPTITVNTGLIANFSVPIRGAVTFAGTATITDKRVSAGAGPDVWAVLLNTGTNTYDFAGDKS